MKKKELWFLFLSFLLSVLIWNLPFAKDFLYPFMLFSTFLHELGHALVTVITGGKVLKIELFKDGSGLTTSKGGISFLIVLSGYLFNSLAGSVLLILSSSKNSQMIKSTLSLILFCISLTIIFFVRDLFTFFTVLIFILGLLFLLNRTNDLFKRSFLCFLAIQSCFFSFYNIFVVFNLSFKTSNFKYNDAFILQEMTVIPAPFWAIFWALSSTLLFLFTLKVISQK